VRVPNRPRLLFAVLLAELATLGAWSPDARAQPRIEDVEDSLAHDRSFKVRVEAALILGRLRQPRSLPALIGALRDQYPAVRASAAQALGRIGSPLARDALLRAAQDSNPLVRRVAHEAIKQVGGMTGGTDEQPPPVPAIRTRRTRKMSFEVKNMGDRSRRAGPALRSHMRDFVVDQLRPFGDVSPRENEGDFAVDGVIKDLSTAMHDDDVEVTCAVQLTISKQPSGGVFMMTSGEATVEKPKRQYKPQQMPSMQLEALENAVRAASEDLVRNLERQ
jgi:HEAT repeat protein